MNRWLSDFHNLLMVNLLSEVSSLPWIVLFSGLFPLGMVFGLGMVGGEPDPQRVEYVITGSAIVSLITTGITATSQTFAFAKERGEFIYFASLPIKRSAYLVSVVLKQLLTTLPGVVVALGAGSLIYDFPVVWSPLLIPIVLLSALSLTAIGTAIGTTASNPQLVNVLSQFILFLLMFASPVLIPIEVLPSVLQWTAKVLPPTYAADALRMVVAGEFGAQVWYDMAVLGVFFLVSTAGVMRGIPWRLR